MPFIVATGSYLPGKTPVSNDMLAEVFGEAAHTVGDYLGIKSRYFCVDYLSGENVSKETNTDFCYKAVCRAVEKTGFNVSDIDLIISVTNSPDYLLPQTSIQLQERLNLKSITTLDIRGGCSAAVQGLLTAQAYIESGLAEHAVVVGSECFSSIYYHYLMKRKDRILVKDLMSSLTFGDGAAAVIVSRHKHGHADFKMEHVVSCSEFAGYPPGFVVALGASKVRHFFEADVDLHKLITHHPKILEKYLPLVTKEMFQRIHARTGYQLGDFDYVVGPQANKRLIEMIRKSLKGKKYVYYGDTVGNVPGGALFLALDKMGEDQDIIKGSKVLLFGVESPKWLYGYCILRRE